MSINTSINLTQFTADFGGIDTNTCVTAEQAMEWCLEQHLSVAYEPIYLLSAASSFLIIYFLIPVFAQHKELEWLFGLRLFCVIASLFLQVAFIIYIGFLA